MAYTPLTFHSRCGENANITESGMRVKRTGLYGYSSAITARLLMTSGLFTIEFNERPALSFGVTTHSPEKIEFPQYMNLLRGTWCLTCHMEDSTIAVNSVTKKSHFIPDATLKALKGGDTLGLQVTKERELIYYVNGESVGVAASNIPEAVYGFVDLSGGLNFTVKLIPDIQEPKTIQAIAARDREVLELRQQLQLREGELQHQLQENETQQEDLLQLLQASEREKDELQQQSERELQNVWSSHQRELQCLRTENQQLRQQMQTAQSESQQTHHTEFWEVPRDDVTLHMQKILGAGGWGFVVEGKFRGQTVAVKCLHNLIREQEFTAVIRREIGIMTQLRHPNLVLLIAAVIDEEDPLIITELLELSLREAYERNQLEGGEHRKLGIFRDVASALNYLHLHHHGPIIHRDVSSANVLLESRPRGQWRAKLSDFGSAKLAREATTTGPGTAVYSAPEVRRDTGIRQSPKVDVYSYGVLLCEVGVGQFPLEGRFPAMMQSLAQRGPLLHQLVSSCTQELPDNRPSMADILADLDRALGN